MAPRKMGETQSTALGNKGGREKSLANLALGKLKPGQSGNPSGRPKGFREVQALAREKSIAAVNTLAEVMEDKSATPQARVAAATAILDRGFGKPKQQLEVGGPGAFSEMSDEQLDAFIINAMASLRSTKDEISAVH